MSLVTFILVFLTTHMISLHGTDIVFRTGQVFKWLSVFKKDIIMAKIFNIPQTFQYFTAKIIHN